VVLVHRPAYDDWTLPKGKAHLNELLPTTAVREVAEESGATIRLAAPLTPIRYPVAQTMKLVTWWVGVTLSAGPHVPDAEVDRIAWMAPDAAIDALTYSDERDILTEALTLPDTTPLIILRHAKAASRLGWKKDDRVRPLSGHGRDQLPYVAQILGPFGAADLVSSPATRCRQTLAAYAKDRKIEIATKAVISQEKATEHKTARYATDLALAVGASGRPTVVCSHAPVISIMLGALGIPARPLATASCVIAHLDASGTVVRTEWHDSLRVKQ